MELPQLLEVHDALSFHDVHPDPKKGQESVRGRTLPSSWDEITEIKGQTRRDPNPVETCLRKEANIFTHKDTAEVDV